MLHPTAGSHTGHTLTGLRHTSLQANAPAHSTQKVVAGQTNVPFWFLSTVLRVQHVFDDCKWRGQRFTCEYTNTSDPAAVEGAHPSAAFSPKHNARKV